jgi:hypothetical protein
MPLGAAAIVGGGSVISGLIGGGAAKSAAKTAADAANKAAELQQQRYETTRSDLAPYNTAGQAVLPQLNALALSGPTGGGTDYVKTAYDQFLPGTMTQAQLEQTPGYQFTRDQGLKAVQSANAARGLGMSGASMKGAAAFATGLANNTYKDQFNLQQTRFADVSGLSTLQQNQLQGQASRLQNVASLGENAGAQTGSAGATLAGQAGNSLIAGGNAAAAGTMGASNALTGGINNALGYYQLQNMINRNNTGGTSNYAGNPATGTGTATNVGGNLFYGDSATPGMGGYGGSG